MLKSDPATRKSHKEKLAEQASLAFDAMAPEPSRLLTLSEARNLKTCLPKLAEMVGQMGIIDKPLCDWSREQILTFLTLAVRVANPLLAVDMADAMVDFDDEIPF